jgi:hypothetical protein
MIIFVLFVSFVVRTVGCKKDANYKNMLHREKPKRGTVPTSLYYVLS